MDTLNPLTLLGIFAGYFSYVIMFFTIFLVNANRSEDTYHFSFLEPLAGIINMNDFNKREPQKIEDAHFLAGIAAGSFQDWGEVRCPCNSPAMTAAHACCRLR